MSIFQHWQEQRDKLRPSLAETMSAAEITGQVRHALLQTEHNALAELDDDLLRQQAAVLMGCLKSALGLLEAHGTAQIWVAQKSGLSKAKSKSLWSVAGALLAGLAALCALKSRWISLGLCVAALAVGLCALISERRSAASILPQDEVRATVTVDIERLFAVLDAQLRAMDRYLSDFSYLNDQARGGAESTDAITLSRAADLMEALYDCDDAGRAPAEEAARRLLERLGLQALDYDEESSRLFNALPSKTVTRTLSPAIVSVRDQQLLRRGTAAVRIDAA